MYCHPAHELTLTIALLGMAAACAAHTPPPAPQSPAKEVSTSVSEWLPLQNNTVLEFSTSVEGTGEQGRLMMQVRRPRANHIELGVAGRIRRLDVLPEGVSIATGGWLLRLPLRVGTSFQGLNGHVTIVNTDRTVDVPAGHFTNCLETEEKTATTKTLTDFCRGTGITRLVIEGQLNGDPRREIAELRFTGPLIDLGPDKTTAAPIGQ